MDASPQKLVTAILPTETDALRLLKRLKEELGIASANLNYARGVGHITRDRSVRATSSQKEILSVVVPEARGDEVFDWLRSAAEIDRPHGGILYVQSLALATHYTLPDVPEEEGEPGP
jgi:hypothetical protein